MQSRRCRLTQQESTRFWPKPHVGHQVSKEGDTSWHEPHVRVAGGSAELESAAAEPLLGTAGHGWRCLGEILAISLTQSLTQAGAWAGWVSDLGEIFPLTIPFMKLHVKNYVCFFTVWPSIVANAFASGAAERSETRGLAEYYQSLHAISISAVAERSD